MTAGVHVGQQETKSSARGVFSDGQLHVGHSHVRPERGNILSRYAVFHRGHRVHGRHPRGRVRVPAGVLQAEQLVPIRGKTRDAAPGDGRARAFDSRCEEGLSVQTFYSLLTEPLTRIRNFVAD